MSRIPGLMIFIALATTPIVAAQSGQPDGDTTRVVTEAVIDAPVDQVWEAFTTKKGIESWMVAHGEIDLKVGGKMRTHYNPKGKLGDAGTIENTILSYDPKRMISIKISKTPEKFPFQNAYKSTWSVIYFDALAAKQTRVKIVMQGYADDEESQKMRQFFDKGNSYTMTKLKEHFQK